MPMKSKPELMDESWVREHYIEKHMTAGEVGALIGVSATAVSRALDRHGIQKRTPQEQMALRGTTRRSGFAELRDKPWLYEHYIEKDMTLEEIAKLVGCSDTPIKQALRRYGIPIKLAKKRDGVVREWMPKLNPNPDVQRHGTKKVPQLASRETLYKDYVEDGHSLSDLGNLYGCNPTSVLSGLRKFGIPTREAVRPAEVADTYVCAICRVEKNVDEFVIKRDRARGVGNQCKPCNAKKNRENTANSPEIREYFKESSRRHRYKTLGITEEQYWTLFAEQDGKCKICHLPTPDGSRLRVDHNHETDDIRGLLCATCNLGLGNFADNVEFLVQAIVYLESDPVIVVDDGVERFEALAEQAIHS